MYIKNIKVYIYINVKKSLICQNDQNFIYIKNIKEYIYKFQKSLQKILIFFYFFIFLFFFYFLFIYFFFSHINAKLAQPYIQ